MRAFIANLEPLRYRDFRLLWMGAFLSFTGTWVQSVAQGWLVFNLTGSEEKLALVATLSTLPVLFLGPFAGSITDTLNKRVVLITCQSVFGINALILAVCLYTKTIRYEFILLVAVINGFASIFEMPTRQSLISKVVPKDLLTQAVPLQAMTFNTARIVGPAIGGFMLAQFGAFSSYLVNGISYLALIFAALALSVDMNPVQREVQPVKDLLLDGMKYTLRDPRLRMLFFMESAVSMFALSYMPLLPAFAERVIGVGKAQLGTLYSAIGIGALCGLFFLINSAKKPWKQRILLISMTLSSLSLIALAWSRTPFLYYPLLATLGLGTIMQFNTTNTLFQSLSPEELRGRVIAMHIWALSGAGAIGLPIFGRIAEISSVPVAYTLAGVVTLGGAALGWIHRKRLAGL